MRRAARADSDTIRCSTTSLSAARLAKRPIGEKMLVSHRAQALEADVYLPPRYRFQRRKPIIVFASMILPD